MGKKKLPAPADPVTEYARGVVAGTIVAGRWVRLACKRHLADLKRKDLVWNPAPAPDAKERRRPADRVIGFFRDVLKLSAGEHEGKPFILSPHQAFIAGSLIGWMLPDGTRRFRVAYVEAGKGDGKSPFAAGMGHYGFVADGEARAEIYAAATKKDQAMILFRHACAMRDQSPQLKARLTKSGTGENAWNLAYRATGSFYRPISSDENSQSGPNPHFALLDEIHEHKTGIVINMMRNGFKGRRQPLQFEITNSGYDRTTVCWEHHEHSLKVLKRLIKDDRWFAYVCTLDPCKKHEREGHEQPVDGCEKCDRWYQKGEHWRKANPNVGVSIGWKYLEDQVREGLEMASQTNFVKRLNFCMWTQAETRWLPIDAWNRCAGQIDDNVLLALRGRRCVAGLDLANTIDIAALVLLFLPEDIVLEDVGANTTTGGGRAGAIHESPVRSQAAAPGDDDGATALAYRQLALDKIAGEFVCLPFFWIPRDNMKTLEKNDRVPYDLWVKNGLVEATEGAVIDYSYIRARLLALKEMYAIEEIGLDMWNATQFYTDMTENYGFKMVGVGQGYKSMNEPTKQLLRVIKGKKLNHGGNNVLTWMADNMVVSTDPAGNVKPNKEKSKQKIDGVVALIIAMARVIAGAAGSGYDARARAGAESVIRTL